MVEAYHYTKKTIDLNAAIEATLRFTDRGGNVTGAPADVRKDNHKTVVVLQDVNPEDAEGITNQGVEPDEAQFLSDLEIEARNALLKAVRDKAADVQAAVLQQARKLAQRGDIDGAAEQYVLYLNSAGDAASPEHDEAAAFLRDRFGLAVAGAAK